MLPGDQKLELPNGQRIPTDVREYAADGAVAPLLPFGPRWFQARARSDFARARASPSAAGPRQGASVEALVEFGERMPLGGDDMTAIGSGLHAVIAAEFVNPSRRDALRTAKVVLQGYGVASFLAAEDAVASARRFHAFVQTHFRPTGTYVEYPVTRRAENGQLMSGWIDLALETEAGWVIIDHKASPRPRSELQDEALQHSGQLFEYRRALEAAGCDVASTWIHFAVSGALARVTDI